MSSPDWLEHAACQGEDPEWWHSENSRSEESRVAKTICLRCPVRIQCLESSLARNEPFGIWGAMTTPERRKLRRKNCA